MPNIFLPSELGVISNGGGGEGAVLTFTVKRNKMDPASIFEKVDGDFNKTNASIGIVSIPLSVTDTNQTPGRYEGELRTVFNVGNVDKSADIILKIERAVKVA